MRTESRLEKKRKKKWGFRISGLKNMYIHHLLFKPCDTVGSCTKVLNFWNWHSVLHFAVFEYSQLLPVYSGLLLCCGTLQRLFVIHSKFYKIPFHLAHMFHLQSVIYSVKFSGDPPPLHHRAVLPPWSAHACVYIQLIYLLIKSRDWFSRWLIRYLMSCH
jgi:hypothetical protein